MYENLNILGTTFFGNASIYVQNHENQYCIMYVNQFSKQYCIFCQLQNSTLWVPRDTAASACIYDCCFINIAYEKFLYIGVTDMLIQYKHHISADGGLF